MGASVRTEDEAFSDERFADLAEYAGLADADHARGKMERLWRQCTIETRYALPVETLTRILGPKGVDAIVRARLGELLEDGTVRIKGTQGRIEWLKKLRKNGRFGKMGGRPKKNPPGYPEGLQNETPPSPSPVPTDQRSETVPSALALEVQTPEPEQPRKRAARSEPKATAPPNGDHQAIIAAFWSGFEAYTGAKPTYTADVGAHVKRLLSSQPASEIVRRVGNFFARPRDAWPTERDFGTFVRYFDRWAVAAVSSQPVRHVGPPIGSKAL